jgi:hypothetical protein
MVKRRSSAKRSGSRGPRKRAKVAKVDVIPMIREEAIVSLEATIEQAQLWAAFVHKLAKRNEPSKEEALGMFNLHKWDAIRSAKKKDVVRAANSVSSSSRFAPLLQNALPF